MTPKFVFSRCCPKSEGAAALGCASQLSAREPVARDSVISASSCYSNAMFSPEPPFGAAQKYSGIIPAPCWTVPVCDFCPLSPPPVCSSLQPLKIANSPLGHLSLRFQELTRGCFSWDREQSMRNQTSSHGGTTQYGKQTRTRQYKQDMKSWEGLQLQPNRK